MKRSTYNYFEVAITQEDKYCYPIIKHKLNDGHSSIILRCEGVLRLMMQTLKKDKKLNLNTFPTR